MEIFQLRDLIHAIDGEFIIGDPNLLIEGVSIDSRTIRKGEAYFYVISLQVKQQCQILL